MELTLESLLSAGSWAGHLSYFLLVVSMMMRGIVWLRVFAISSALAGIAYDVFWLEDPVGVFWESLLLIVNVGQLAVIYWQNRRVSFSAEDASFVNAALPTLSPRVQRRLLNLGCWLSSEPGTVITRQGEPVEKLVWLASGSVAIRFGEREIARCGAGSFVGEMTVLTKEPATGTAVVSAPSRYWAVEGRVLRRAATADPDLRQALNRGFSTDLRGKLKRLSQAAAETPGDRAAGD